MTTSRRLVLVVEDGAPVQLAALAATVDADVAWAPSIDEALSLTEGRSPDAAILRPGRTGDAVANACRAFTSQAAYESVPFAVVGHSVLQARAAFAHGALDFWREPVDDTFHAQLIESLWARPMPMATHRDAPCVLVADDDLFFLRRISDLLEAAGYRTLQARSGVEALALLEEAPARPALCVMDLFMPQLGGIELLGRLRESPRWANLPVIAVSGVRRDKAVQEGLERLGVWDFVDKAAVAIDSVAAIADEYLSDPTARRAAPRVSTFALAGFRRATEEPWLTGLVCNLSETGAFVRTLLPPPPSRIVPVRLELGAGQERLVTSARVAWTRSRQHGSPEPHGMGLEFHAFTDADRATLAHWVAQGALLPVETAA